MHTLALYKPRFFIIEAGGSFDLLADYCASLGLSVNKVKINLTSGFTNPFASGLKVLDQIAALEVTQRTQWLINTETITLISGNRNNAEEMMEESMILAENRDILGEMVLAALVMITGGEPKEEERIRRSDRMLIMEAIILRRENVRQAGHPQMIASDIVAAFEQLAAHSRPATG